MRIVIFYSSGKIVDITFRYQVNVIVQSNNEGTTVVYLTKWTTIGTSDGLLKVIGSNMLDIEK